MKLHDIVEELRVIAAETVPHVRSHPEYERSLVSVATEMWPFGTRRRWLGSQVCASFSRAVPEIDKLVMRESSREGVKFCAVAIGIAPTEPSADAARERFAALSRRLGLALQQEYKKHAPDRLSEIVSRQRTVESNSAKFAISWLSALAGRSPIRAYECSVGQVSVSAVIQEMSAAAMESRGTDPFQLFMAEVPQREVNL